ncbi:glucosyltransferase domain-containing protein [Bartonella sp. LJL80]
MMVDAKLDNNQKFYITAILSILVFYFPLIISNDYYRDDYFRVVEQQPGWSPLGRPFADILAHIISADWQWLPDSSPLFLVVALVLIVTATCRALQVRKLPFNCTTATLLITFLFNPFLLASMLYRFDCVIMAAGLACGLMAWAYFPTAKIRAALFCFIAMGFYQSFINVFTTLMIIEVLYRLYRGDSLQESGRYLLKGLILAVVICVLYYLFAKLFIQKFAEQKSALVFMGDRNILYYYSVMLENVYSRYFGFLSSTGKSLYGLAILVGLLEIQLRFYKDAQFSHRFLRAAIVSFTFILILPLSLGVLYGVVGNGRIAPRLMASSIFFSVVIVFLTLRFSTRLQRSSLVLDLQRIATTRITWFIIILILICPLAFSYIANNAIRNQNKRDQYLVQQLATSLEKYPIDKPAFILGKFGVAPFVDTTSERMRLLRHMLPRVADWTLWLRLKQFGYDNVIWAETHIDVRKTVGQLCSTQMKPDTKRPYFSIYDIGDHLFIWVGRREMCLTEYNGIGRDDED